MKKLLTVCLALSFVSTCAFAGHEVAPDDCQKVYRENAIVNTLDWFDWTAAGWVPGYWAAYHLIKEAKQLKAEGGELKFRMRRFMSQKHLEQTLGFVPTTEQVVGAVLEGNEGDFCLDKKEPMTYKEVKKYVIMKLKGGN